MNLKQDISQADFERIEKYLSDKMGENEKLFFEKELKETPALNAKLDELKLIFEGIEKAEFKEKLNQFHREMGKDSNLRIVKTTSFNWKSLAVAASIIFIAVISVIFYNRPNANERLFAAYYKTDPGLVTAMSSKEMDYEFERGMVDFKSGEFQSAVNRWEPLLAGNPNSDTLNYFLGTAYLELRYSTQAIQNLHKVSENSQSKFVDDANWYLALAYILEDKKDEARQALIRTNHPLKAQLLNRLEEK
ncbi:MAG: hypothetical protein R2757_05920 [Draconibacterium sp.]